MPMMSCPRHYTLRTTTGHAIRFEPNKPKFVPDNIVSEALKVNILPVEGSVEDAEFNAGGIVKLTINGELRKALTLYAIDVLVKENDTVNFDGGGRPKVAPINEMTGLTLTAKEREDSWQQYRQIKGNGEELPTHKSLEMVLEVQAISSPRDIKEYATILGVPEEKLIGHPLRLQKQILLGAAVKP